MNGRGIVALSGFALIINVILQAQATKLAATIMLIRFLVALLLCSVSSGALFVGISTLILFLFSQLQIILLQSLRLRLHAQPLKAFSSGLIGCVVFSGIVFVGIIKNITFFGIGADGVIKMLTHGIGEILIPVFDVISIPWLVLIIIGIGFFANLLINMFTYPLILRIFFICIVCGLFGTTTLLMAIVPTLIMLDYFLTRVGMPGPQRKLSMHV